MSDDQNELKITRLKQKAFGLRRLARGILGGDFQSRLLELALEYEQEAASLAGARIRLLGCEWHSIADSHSYVPHPYQVAFSMYRERLAKWRNTRDVRAFQSARVWQRVAKQELNARHASLALDLIVLRFAQARRSCTRQREAPAQTERGRL